MKPPGSWRHETVLAAVVVALMVGIGLVNPAFWTLANFFDLLKASVVTGILALGVLIVLISGGIDISFTAIAAFAMYVTCWISVSLGGEGSVLLGLLLAVGMGTGLGLINACFIGGLRLPTLIVTLGTAGVFHGFLLAFIGTEIINTLPPAYVRFSRWQGFRQTLSGGETIGLSVTVLALVAAAVIVGVLLRRTVLGRSIYALGGNPEAAHRIGIRVARVQFLIYGLVGGLAGLAGLIHAVMMRNANPSDLVGTELNVLAAAVLGGASIFGGRGSVAGTLLGVWLIVVLNNSLILLGVPSYWQRVWVGATIVVSTAISARRRSS
ncbi:MAG: ABC transporter permease [Verrucomicrobiales bacterium]|nr:ABC transporter permease [Verrucomicrobiales bacterium]